jgi:hypothetical protein
MQIPWQEQPMLLRAVDTARRAVPCAALLLAMATPGLAAQQQEQQPAAAHAAARAAAAEVARVQEEVRAWYEARRQPSRGNPPRHSCDATTGEDCFGGDVECHYFNACAWPAPRDEMTRLALLYDSAAAVVRRAPADSVPAARHWVDGQRVGGWTRLGRFDRAREALAECTSAAWWCDALHGMVEHRQAHYVEAEARFRAALAAMPAGRACYWNEVALLLDTTAASVHHGGRTPCRSLQELEGFWLLADPLFTMPGNERMTEHYARHAEMAIHEDFLSAFQARHTAPHHSTVLRLGWPNGFRVLPQLQTAALRTELTHNGGTGLLVPEPLPAALELPWRSYAPRPGDAREQFVLPWGALAAVTAQYGFLRRGGADGLLVRVAEATSHGDGWRLVSWDGSGWREGEVTTSPSASYGWIGTPWTPQVFSMERPTERGALRARSGTRTPTSSGSSALSSLLLLAGQQEWPAPPATPELAAAMLPGTDVAVGEEVSAYWEVYTDAPRRSTVTLSTLRTTRPDLLSRLLRRGRAAERSVRWDELLQPAGGVAHRRVKLDVTGLAAGEYLLRLEVLLEDGSRMNSETLFRVVTRQLPRGAVGPMLALPPDGRREREPHRSWRWPALPLP